MFDVLILVRYLLEQGMLKLGIGCRSPLFSFEHLIYSQYSAPSEIDFVRVKIPLCYIELAFEKYDSGLLKS